MFDYQAVTFKFVNKCIFFVNKCCLLEKYIYICRVATMQQQLKTKKMNKLSNYSAKQIKLETNYWGKVLEDSTKEDILNLAKSMGLPTHHNNGRQRALKDIKAGIAYNKIHDFRTALNNFNNK